MSNSFKNLQTRLHKLKKPDEPKRRKSAVLYIQELTKLINDSYIDESTSDYMFIKTLEDAIIETKYFGGFTEQTKESLSIIEKRYNYIYEEGNTDIE